MIELSDISKLATIESYDITRPPSFNPIDVPEMSLKTQGSIQKRIFGLRKYVRKCSLSSFESRLVERKRSLIDMDSETKERSRWRRLEHFERAARQFTLHKVRKGKRTRAVRAGLWGIRSTQRL